ncbi:MAG: hypothetical protein ACOC5L_01675 [Halobacteriota archaeon]
MQLEMVVDSYIKKVPQVKQLCDRCLKVERYGGNVVLMIVDASFVSLGVNYFTVVVPNVFEFKEKLVDTHKILSLNDLASYDARELSEIWKNKRSWNAAREIASYLSSLDENDKTAFVKWAEKSRLKKWKSDPVGRIKGVGINTYQYLRMMGGIDTVMPDKIVKKVFKEIGEKSGEEMPADDMGFIKRVEEMACSTGYRPIELCWMTWLIQYREDEAKIREYSRLMSKI